MPTIFRSFLFGDRVFPDIRVVRLEGDQAARSDVALFRKHFGRQCVLVNGLGTTETGLVSQYFARGDTEISDSVLPVGNAVEGMAVTIVGDDGRPAAQGEVGEIAVTSEYLAVGYENRPDLTRERFGDVHRAGRRRTYRTGDLGWMDAGGCLRHLGRKGSDVKVRGESVEPAEVECAILDLPCIRDVAVIATRDREGDVRLVAYVVPAENPGPTVSQLRQRMAAAVPASMIPAIWITLQALPRNAAGKIDRARFRPRAAIVPTSIRHTPPRRRRSRCASPRSGRSFSRSVPSVPAMISSSSAAIPCWPCGFSSRSGGCSKPRSPASVLL